MLVEAIICCNKHRRIEKVLPGVPIRKWVISVQEDGYLLGRLGSRTVSTPRVNSWSILKVKLAVLEIQADPNKADIYEILADIPKGDRNQNPTEIHYSIPCPSFGLVNFTKSFYVVNNWWDIQPCNSDRTRNQLYVHWSNRFWDLYGTNKIPHWVFNMADNQLCNLYSRHILKQGGNNYPYFYYNENNRVYDWIKYDYSESKERHSRNLN